MIGSSLMLNTSETIFCVLSGCIENYSILLENLSLCVCMYVCMHALDPTNISKVPLEYRTALSEAVMVLVLSDKKKI